MYLQAFFIAFSLLPLLSMLRNGQHLKLNLCQDLCQKDQYKSITSVSTAPNSQEYWTPQWPNNIPNSWNIRIILKVRIQVLHQHGNTLNIQQNNQQLSTHGTALISAKMPQLTSSSRIKVQSPFWVGTTEEERGVYITVISRNFSWSTS